MCIFQVLKEDFLEINVLFILIFPSLCLSVIPFISHLNAAHQKTLSDVDPLSLFFEILTKSNLADKFILMCLAGGRLKSVNLFSPKWNLYDLF